MLHVSFSFSPNRIQQKEKRNEHSSGLDKEFACWAVLFGFGSRSIDSLRKLIWNGICLGFGIHCMRFVLISILGSGFFFWSKAMFDDHTSSNLLW